MQAHIAAITLVGCYLVIGFGLVRGIRAWLDWRDARAVQEFDAQCMLANAEAFRDLRLNSPFAYARDERGYVNPADLDPCDQAHFYSDDWEAA